MAALFNPAHYTKEGIRRGLVLYTAVMFSVVTVLTAMNLNRQSISYIDNREFPGIKGVAPPGPYGYQILVFSDAFNIVISVMFLLNGLLADGLLVGSWFGVTFTLPRV